MNISIFQIYLIGLGLTLMGLMALIPQMESLGYTHKRLLLLNVVSALLWFISMPLLLVLSVGTYIKRKK
jgi:hypothetical protein